LIIKKMRLQEQDSPTNKITVMTIIILTILIIFTAPLASQETQISFTTTGEKRFRVLVSLGPNKGLTSLRLISEATP
jgi:hypothetical protein